MIEILVSGDCESDFKRLGVNPVLTYSSDSTHYMVYEVTQNEFKILCDEPDIDGTWKECGWRHCDGSNMGYPNARIKINEEKIKCWFEEFEDEQIYLEDYDDLLEYINEECGATTFKNVCALTVDLAKYNNMKLSELFNKYQG